MQILYSIFLNSEKNKGFIGFGFLAIGICLFLSCHRDKETREKEIAQHLLVQVDSFSTFIRERFLPFAQTDTVQEAVLQELFLDMRLRYKRMEWAAEYFTGSTSRFVNGPPVEEIGLTGLYSFQPEGLQVMEELLFPIYKPDNQQTLVHYTQLLLDRCAAYEAYFKHIPMANWQVLDAAKQEIFRILTLGITGFDNPLTLHSMEESAVCLESLQEVLAPYIRAGQMDGLSNLMTDAARYLRTHPDFNTFDRAFFIRQYGNPISTELTRLGQKLAVRFIQYNRLLRQDAYTLFDKHTFDVDAYAPGPDYRVTEKRIALGKQLFADPILSDGHGRSCASCHQPERAFTDGLIKNRALNGKAFLQRNTPSLLYAAVQPMQFYDLRALSLEDQVSDVVHNEAEMHGSLSVAAQQLWQDTSYRRLFSAAYPKKQRKAIDTVELTNALSTYIRSLSTFNSRFDRYMRGNDQAMNREEIKGFNTFMGKAKCATCHYMPLFNGTFPPKYYKIEAEVLGVPAKVHGKVIDADRGQYAIMPFESLQHAFKTATVRNTSKTAPYMHNGVFATMEEVLDFYNNGGGVGMGIAVENQTLSADSLHLTPQEIREVIAFMKSLDEE